jgi:hypothetical protein
VTGRTTSLRPSPGCGRAARTCWPASAGSPTISCRLPAACQAGGARTSSGTSPATRRRWPGWRPGPAPAWRIACTPGRSNVRPRSRRQHVIPRRLREVSIHAVDLDAGAALTDFPAGFIDLLLDDVTDTLSRRENCPSVVLRPSDRDGEWRLGRGTGSAAASITAPAAGLAGWLTGRLPASALPGQAPALPRWL